MDRAEAINLFEKNIAYWKDTNHEAAKKVVESSKLAIAALREQDGKDANVPTKWISVKERLPEGCGMACLLVGVNCFGQRDVFEGFTGYMEKGKFEWHTNLKDKDMAVWTITHWRPLPEPPKEGAEG